MIVVLLLFKRNYISKNTPFCLVTVILHQTIGDSEAKRKCDLSFPISWHCTGLAATRSDLTSFALSLSGLYSKTDLFVFCYETFYRFWTSTNFRLWRRTLCWGRGGTGLARCPGTTTPWPSRSSPSSSLIIYLSFQGLHTDNLLTFDKHSSQQQEGEIKGCFGIWTEVSRIQQQRRQH